MGLDTSINRLEREFVSTELNDLKKCAKEFQRVCLNQNKKEALRFFAEQPESYQKYIMQTKPYNFYWRSSRIQF